MTSLPVEVRCPQNPARLFMLISIDPDVTITPGNLIEVSCRDCKKQEQRAHPELEVVRVTHLYNVVGELVSSSMQTAC